MTTQRQGVILKEYRKSKKITQKTMAIMAGVSRNHISAIERGIHRANAKVILSYIIACDINPCLLVDGCELTIINYLADKESK